LKLVIADSDKWYAENLGNYIRAADGSRFNVSVFTRVSSITDFFGTGGSGADIFLASPDMLPEDIPQPDAGTVFILGSGNTCDSNGRFPSIYKYQPADRLLSELMEKYLEKNPGAAFPLRSDKKAHVIQVFSPQGGSGKSVISFFTALQYARMGLRTLYLNIESISCANSFICPAAGRESDFPKLLYYLKKYKKNLSHRVNSLKSYSSELKIYHFGQTCSSYELDETTAEDMESLIQELKYSGLFDMVVLDADSALSRRNAASLCGSDRIVLVILQDAIGLKKLDNFCKELSRVIPSAGTEILDKSVPVVNRFSGGASKDDVRFNGRTVDFRIPYVQDIYTAGRGECPVNLNSSLNTYVKALAASMLESLKLAPAGGYGNGHF